MPDFSLIPSAGPRQLERRLRRALAEGGTRAAGSPPHRTAVALLGGAMRVLPALAGGAAVLELASPPPHHARQVRRQAGRALAGAHAGLRAHGREIGYRVGPWEQHALRLTADLVAGTPPERAHTPVQAVRASSALLIAALTVAESDVMGVPVQVSGAVAHLLALHLLAEELSRR